ncbi:hypothetical protein SAMN05216226_110149 [Halovenus aranensis]|uniref:Uncharacterized protein n=1 Tax=Halovenus aranensis TaxID=890420 RepID=A0A1G8X816_9EURY|nr:hypothetical protein [Halovenus aranensis]SDJ86527.1 hypothetical protein SAMN05216226_110149 [Halovenus aranensis]
MSTDNSLQQSLHDSFQTIRQEGTDESDDNDSEEDPAEKHGPLSPAHLRKLDAGITKPPCPHCGNTEFNTETPGDEGRGLAHEHIMCVRDDCSYTYITEKSQ